MPLLMSYFSKRYVSEIHATLKKFFEECVVRTEHIYIICTRMLFSNYSTIIKYRDMERYALTL